MANSKTVFMDLQSVDDDLFISELSGDFVIAESDQQHISDILRSYPGEWKENPEIGVGLRGYFESAGKEQEIERNILVQLKADGYNVTSPKIDFVDSKLTITPNATR
jgi:hypothetical protein